MNTETGMVYVLLRWKPHSEIGESGHWVIEDVEDSMEVINMSSRLLPPGTIIKVLQSVEVIKE